MCANHTKNINLTIYNCNLVQVILSKMTVNIK